MSHRKAGWAITAAGTALALGCSYTPTNPWKPGEVDLAALPGLCSAAVLTFPVVPLGANVYSDQCTYVGRDANGDSVPGALMQWKVEPGIVPLTTTTLDPIGRARVSFIAPATPGDSVQLWMCASTLPPPCALVDYGGTVRFP